MLLFLSLASHRLVGTRQPGLRVSELVDVGCQ